MKSNKQSLVVLSILVLTSPVFGSFLTVSTNQALATASQTALPALQAARAKVTALFSTTGTQPTNFVPSTISNSSISLDLMKKFAAEQAKSTAPVLSSTSNTSLVLPAALAIGAAALSPYARQAFNSTSLAIGKMFQKTPAWLTRTATVPAPEIPILEKENLKKAAYQRSSAGYSGFSGGAFKPTAKLLMSRKQAYNMLDVSEQATAKDIKTAYRELVKKHHPDVAGTQSTAKMQELQQAYEIASNKQAATTDSDSTTHNSSNNASNSHSNIWEEFYKKHQEIKKMEERYLNIFEMIRNDSDEYPDRNYYLEKIKKWIDSEVDLNFVFTNSWYKDKTNGSLTTNESFDNSNQREMCSKGDTPLSIAVGTGDLKIVQLFLEKGARNGLQHALNKAAGYGNTKMFDLLLQHGAQVNADILISLFTKPKISSDILRQILNTGIDPVKVIIDNATRYSLLYDPKVIEALIKAGFNFSKDDLIKIIKEKSYNVGIDFLKHLPYILENGTKELTPDDVREIYTIVKNQWGHLDQNNSNYKNVFLADEALKNWLTLRGERFS